MKYFVLNESSWVKTWKVRQKSSNFMNFCSTEKEFKLSKLCNMTVSNELRLQLGY